MTIINFATKKETLRTLLQVVNTQLNRERGGGGCASVSNPLLLNRTGETNFIVPPDPLQFCLMPFFPLQFMSNKNIAYPGKTDKM